MAVYAHNLNLYALIPITLTCVGFWQIFLMPEVKCRKKYNGLKFESDLFPPPFGLTYYFNGVHLHVL